MDIAVSEEIKPDREEKGELVSWPHPKKKNCGGWGDLLFRVANSTICKIGGRGFLWWVRGWNVFGGFGGGLWFFLGGCVGFVIGGGGFCLGGG